jgi:hypothetical protein
MDDLVHFDEECWQVEENINHIQLFRKYWRNDKNKLNLLKEDWNFGYQTQQKLRVIS